MSRNFAKYFLMLAMLTTALPGAYAEVKLPNVLADHMVLQREKPVHVWGSADPGEMVSVSFRKHQASTTADTLGRWSVYLPPGDAGGPFTLTVQGKNTISFSDVLVGDLWIASGQSNMEMPLLNVADWARGVLNAEQEIAAATYPKLRLYHVQKTFSEYPMGDVAAETSWTECSPQSVKDFSGVAYFFGRELLQKEKVPIGLIEADWGGTPAEAWTSLSALGADAGLMPVFAARAGMMQDEAKKLLEIKAETQAKEEAKAQGKPAPKFAWHADLGSWEPGALFNGMIAPFTPLPIRGVIWYQGESNTGDERASIYGKLFQTMIRDWRAHWGQGEFPFLFVQIANYTASDGWAVVREQQRQSLVLANTGMAVTIDIGDSGNVHPQDKQNVGHRLALWARNISYGESIEDSGPLFEQAVPMDHSMRVWFTHVSGGLKAKGAELQSFEVAGADGKFVAAKAEIDGYTLRVWNADVPAPMYVRYGWAGDPKCNLYNDAGLPASPFTSKQ